MYRCPICGARKEFYVRRLGYRIIVKETTDFVSKNIEVETSSGKILSDKHRHYTMNCKSCGHKDKVSEFIKAYTDPITYFDADNLCDCGGEVWNDIEAQKIKTSMPVDEFDGDQRSVPMVVRNVLRCERCKKEKLS